eukprot:gene19581-25484_t
MSFDDDIIDDNDESDDIIDLIDDVNINIEDDLASPSVIQDDRKKIVEKLIITAAESNQLFVQGIRWFNGRIEVILSSEKDESVSPSAELLQSTHIIVASPGIGEVLKTHKDFISFKGFTVTVTMTEDYKNNKEFKGNLIGRSDGLVSISMKGRIKKLPWNQIVEVRLPKTKYEPTDYEIKKLKL